MYVEDTIAAIATPPGQGGVGIIRVSGPLSASIAAALFTARQPVERWQSHRLYHGRVSDEDGGLLDAGLAVLMRAPRSYTGEDVLELHCHGSPTALRRVLGRVLQCGARLAEPGEFTKRAFLNGRMELTQAEAVMDLVRARSSAAVGLAAQQLAGRLGEHVAGLRDQLIRLKALLEAQIDFAEENFEVEASELTAVLDVCLVSISKLIDTYRHGSLIRDGVRVAIVGKPNVGKSSLLNALLGAERAIVTPVAGTTRDTIEETADFGGLPVVLTDTAGLREDAGADPVERIGMQRTSSAIATAQLLLTVLDASAPLDAADRTILQAAAERPRIIVLNKTDLGIGLEVGELHALRDGAPRVEISATHGHGLTALRQAVIDRVTEGRDMRADGLMLTNVRHHAALTRAVESLELARQSIHERRPPDLVAVDVQDALDHVGAVTGAVTSEDVLDRIFSEFCIGK